MRRRRNKSEHATGARTAYMLDKDELIRKRADALLKAGTKMTITAFAKRLGVTQQRVRAVLDTATQARIFERH